MLVRGEFREGECAGQDGSKPRTWRLSSESNPTLHDIRPTKSLQSSQVLILLKWRSIRCSSAPLPLYDRQRGPTTYVAVRIHPVYSGQQAVVIACVLARKVVPEEIRWWGDTMRMAVAQRGLLALLCAFSSPISGPHLMQCSKQVWVRLPVCCSRVRCSFCYTVGIATAISGRG